MRLLTSVVVLFFSIAASAAVKDLGWCSVDMPESVSPGSSFTIQVTPKKNVPAGCNVSVHMHHVKAGGQWGGMYEWRPAQNPKGVGKALVFNFTAKKGADVKDFRPMLFVAPGGDFNKKLKEFDVNLGAIGYQVSAAEKAQEAASAKPANCTYKKSWIRLSRDGGEKGRLYRKGESVTVKVKYYLDPSENWGAGTTLKVIPLGPWIDNPDGVVNKSRTHVFIHGFWPLDKKNLATGEHEFELVWKVESASAPYCEIGFMAQFVGGDGKNFPWQTRGAGFSILPEPKPFRVWAESAGGLYRYGENPVVKIEGSVAAAEAKVALTDSQGEAFYSATLPVKDRTIVVPSPKRRGTVLCEVTIGSDTRSCFFATIPDVSKALGGKRAPFGCTNVYDEDAARAAELIGFKYCRLFTGWGGLEPARGKFTFEGLDKTVDNLNRHGISPHVMIIGAPEWALPEGVHSPGFEPYPFDKEGWREAAAAFAKRYKGRILGFEWLNEIMQGNKTQRPVEDYVEFCRIGTQAVKAVDPTLQIQMAGGLWPRSFRLDVLRAGVAKYLDVLPVHYGHHGEIVEAANDFRMGGGTRVWDNESARGYSVWNMPAKKALLDSVTQSMYVMRQWPGEFIAGAEAVVYFGGEANSCGNWTYLLDAHSPRPVAATLAVLAAKIGDVRPVGCAYLEPGAIVYLFEKKNGKGLAFVMGPNEKDEGTIELPVGDVTRVTLTDFCGNESVLPAAGGKVTVGANPMPVIVEDFDYSRLAAAVSLSVAGQGPLTPRPSVRFITGGTAKVQVTVTNPFREIATGAVAAKLGSAKAKPQAFSLKPGESAFFDFDLGPTQNGVDAGEVAVGFKGRDAKFARAFAVNVINPDLLGNLIRNGNMEAGGDKPDGWWASGMRRAALDGSAPGYEGFAFEMRDNKGYASGGQNFKLPAPGIKYLYTSWVWTANTYCGSNASVSGPGGKRNYTIPSCFSAPGSTEGWVLLCKVLDAVPQATDGNVAPVGQLLHGQTSGWAKYDNIRVSAYEDTEYAAEAHAAKKPVKIDGNLSDWDFSDPIPLCCENQITEKRGGYVWTRNNLSGVAAFSWDKDALYFAAKVKDDVHETAAHEKTPLGDSITIALHPGNRVPGTDAQAGEWFLSDCSPGGGSGMYTLYRPAAHAAGLKSGQLAKDSSNYDIVVKTSGGITVYELRMPWSEIRGAVPEVGTKLGLSLRLSDADGSKFGRINWGMGLDPAWAPTAFGVMTLVK